MYKKNNITKAELLKESFDCLVDVVCEKMNQDEADPNSPVKKDVQDLNDTQNAQASSNSCPCS